MRRRRRCRVTSRSFSSGVASLLLLRMVNSELLHMVDVVSGFRCVYSVC